MTDRMLDLSIRRSATEDWYVSERASQRDRYARCLNMLLARSPRLGVIYDLGAGTGHFAGLLAAHAQRVVGVERLAERVARSQEDHAGTPNLEFVATDFLDLDIAPASADAVCALEMLYYVDADDRGPFLEKIARVLAPGGVLLASLNVFSRAGVDGERELLEAIGERFEILDVRHMHRAHYYQLELPLIRLLDEITYLERVKVFYPHTLAIEHVVYSPWLDRLLLPPSWPLDRVLLPACRRAALALLRSRTLYRLVTGASRLLAPRRSKSQVIVLARRPAGESVFRRSGHRFAEENA